MEIACAPSMEVDANNWYSEPPVLEKPMSKEECCALILAELRACKDAIVESIRGIGSKRGDAAAVRTSGVLGSEKPRVESAPSGAQAAAPASCIDLGIAVQPVAAPDAMDCDVGLNSSPPLLSSAVPLQAHGTTTTDKEASTVRDTAAALSPAVDGDHSSINFDVPTTCSTKCPSTCDAIPVLAIASDAALTTSTTSAMLDGHMAPFTVSLAGDDVLVDIGEHALTTCLTVCPLFDIHVPVSACVLRASPTAPRTPTLRGAPTSSAALLSLVSVERATWSAHQAFDEMPWSQGAITNSITSTSTSMSIIIATSGCTLYNHELPGQHHGLLVPLFMQQPWAAPALSEIKGNGAEIRPMPWPSFSIIAGDSSVWTFSWLWKPPWLPPAQRHMRI
ncbi:hypothetical protein ACP70R_008074 [Stipagrostis hirtigluma subsp. patula]